LQTGEEFVGGEVINKAGFNNAFYFLDKNYASCVHTCLLFMCALRGAAAVKTAQDGRSSGWELTR